MAAGLLLRAPRAAGAHDLAEEVGVGEELLGGHAQRLERGGKRVVGGREDDRRGGDVANVDVAERAERGVERLQVALGVGHGAGDVGAEGADELGDGHGACRGGGGGCEDGGRGVRAGRGRAGAWERF
jgi:hypothetical protein